MTIVVTSALPLTTTYQDKIAAALAKKHPQASVDFQVDEQLIAGLKITVGSSQLDYSFASQLQLIEKQLLTN